MHFNPISMVIELLVVKLWLFKYVELGGVSRLNSECTRTYAFLL
jgi:hypothetical protein